MLRVFLAVEGRNDGGALGRSLAARDNDEQHEGALQPLVRGILGDKIRGDKIAIRGQSTGQFFLQNFPEPEDARGRRARMAAALAAEDGCDVLVFHCDVDAGTSIDNARRAWTDCAGAVRDGFDKAAAEDPSRLSSAACVGALPCRTIEAWLLADSSAIARVRSAAVTGPVPEIDAPEHLWDKNRPGSDHPKHVLRRVLGGAERPRATSNDYLELAMGSDPDVLAARCPISFVPFRDALLSAAGEA